ncbi:unnamed protein product [Thelazia callipaeda]|uniref:FLYWCH-type domain-containing protein n=1 Tax=Thelazia callipaeda TaxID=103827 RepID=A0A0N5CM32_THECL|nr:unnamed protein product [Thelazia callipaeda]
MVATVKIVQLRSESSSCSLMETEQQQGSTEEGLDLRCDEEFDESLMEKPTTSFNANRQCIVAPGIQQSPESFNNQEHDLTDSPLLTKMKREWRTYGWYTSFEEMDKVRRWEKVSKRKNVTSIHGTKVFYRCNSWQRTKCNFHMYAIIFAPDKICLFASGEHDHTTKDSKYTTDAASNTQKESNTKQQNTFAQSIMNTNTTLQTDVNFQQDQKFSSSNIFLPPPDLSFELKDEKRIAEMLTLACDINHKFTYNQKSNEFYFEPINPAFKGRSVVLLNAGAVVLVVERYNGIEISREIWKKGNWDLFLWAVRGKCMRITYQNYKEAGQL